MENYKTTILGGCGTNTQYDYKKKALLSSKLKGQKIILEDKDMGEYKSLLDALGGESEIIKKSTN